MLIYILDGSACDDNEGRIRWFLIQDEEHDTRSGWLDFDEK
jgi:hypothetical protein